MTSVSVVSKAKLPAWSVLMQQVHSAAPVDIIGFITAGPFLAYVVGGNDVAKIRKGL